MTCGDLLLNNVKRMYDDANMYYEAIIYDACCPDLN